MALVYWKRNQLKKTKKSIIHLIKILVAMKKKEKKKKKKDKEKLKKPGRDISDIIDELAYADESENIRKIRKFLDDMYILSQE